MNGSSSTKDDNYMDDHSLVPSWEHLLMMCTGTWDFSILILLFCSIISVSFIFSYIWFSIVLAQICPTWISEFVRPGKNQRWTRIFRLNFKSGDYIFYISIVRTRFWPEFRLIRIIQPGKNRGSVINFLSEFWHCPICPTRIRIFVSTNFLL